MKKRERRKKLRDSRVFQMDSSKPFTLKTWGWSESLFQSQLNVPSGKVNAFPCLCLAAPLANHFNPFAMSKV